MPSDVFPDGKIPKIISGQDEKGKFNKYKCWSKIGLGLIIIGFILQIIGSLISK